MRATVRPRDARELFGRYRLELLWAAAAVGCYVALIVWPSIDSAHPFRLLWISLALLYGFRVWPLRGTVLLFSFAIAAAIGGIVLDSLNGMKVVGDLIEIPLLAALFLAMIWHARQRVDAIASAETRAEEQHALLESQERFIHDASHELRTPVTIARGHLELARAQIGDTTDLDIALDELARIDAIISRLLVLATVDQPNFLMVEEIELEPFLEDVFVRWSDVAPRVWRLGQLIAGRLRVDPQRLRSALDALFENAVKYTEEQNVIELRAIDGGPGIVKIEVEDDGSGVPQEALDRIFDRFARADAARARSSGGVGLGLAIVDAIVKGHDGRASVRSTGRGSVFALQMPGFSPGAATDLQAARLFPESTV